jgi:type I restriction enzyme, S subunit
MIKPEMLCPSWPNKPLGEVVDFLDHLRRPITARDREPGPYPYYGANGQQDSVANFIFDEPLILMAEDGGYFDDPRRAIAYRVEGKCWVNNHAHVLRPKPGVNIDFLCRQLEQYDVTRFINGATRQKLNKSTATEIPITLPPLSEQKRIAAILDKADAIRQKRQAAIKLAEDFLRATFLDMFGDPITNPKGWNVVPLKKLGYVTTGNTPPRINPGFYGNDIEWIKSDNINTPYHYLSKATERLSKSGKKVARTAPPLSTLITCIAGSFNCIGNAALTDRDVCFNQQINAITPYVNTDPFFLYVQILAAKKIIQNASTNSMKGMVSKGIFEQIMLFQPPKDLQRKFGFFFEKYLKTMNTIRSFESINSALFNSLIQRAFQGEL